MDDFNVINYSCLFPVFTSQNVCCFTSTLKYTKRSFDLFVLIVGYQLNASCDLGLFGEQSQRVWDELNMQSNPIPKICLTIQTVVATCYQMRHTAQKQHQNVTCFLVKAQTREQNPFGFLMAINLNLFCIFCWGHSGTDVDATCWRQLFWPETAEAKSTNSKCQRKFDRESSLWDTFLVLLFHGWEVLLILCSCSWSFMHDDICKTCFVWPRAVLTVASTCDIFATDTSIVLFYNHQLCPNAWNICHEPHCNVFVFLPLT